MIYNSYHTQRIHEILRQMDAERAAENLKARKNPARENPRELSEPPAQIVKAILAAIPQQRRVIRGTTNHQGGEMKALSIRQPYAGLIIAGIKTIENRTWSTKYTGRLVIVSTAKPDALQWWAPMRKKCAALGVKFPEDLCAINGAALGTVEFNHLTWLEADG